jgi:tetratricopeptide (TPR) repeat protein
MTVDTAMQFTRLAFAMLALVPAIAAAQQPGNEDGEARTVIGPTNVDLADGAEALRAGDAAEGVRLTERGLRSASSRRDRLAGYSNLCAGLVMLDRYEEALESCNTAIAMNDRHWRSYNNRALAYLKLGRFSEAERDIERGQELNPDARTLKFVKSMYLDAVDPVSPNVIIDDRRQGPAGEN